MVIFYIVLSSFLIKHSEGLKCYFKGNVGTSSDFCVTVYDYRFDFVKARLTSWSHKYPTNMVKCYFDLCNGPEYDLNTTVTNLQCYESTNSSLGNLTNCPKEVNACALRMAKKTSANDPDIVLSRSCATMVELQDLNNYNHINNVELCRHSGCNNFTQYRKCYEGVTNKCSGFKPLFKLLFSSPVQTDCDYILYPDVCTTTEMKMKVNNEEIICKFYGCYHLKADYYLEFKKDPKLEKIVDEAQIDGNPVDIIVKQCTGDKCNEYDTRKTDNINCYVGKDGDVHKCPAEYENLTRNPKKDCGQLKYCVTEKYFNGCIIYHCFLAYKYNFTEGVDYYNDTKAEYFRCNTSLCNTEKEESGIIGELSHATMPKIMVLMIWISLLI
uniref:Uncharacterized protein n=2 Tax=Panagrolaimus sp. JU765 TaxID=591449 RepID=A0AC34RNG3_9BILA